MLVNIVADDVDARFGPAINSGLSTTNGTLGNGTWKKTIILTLQNLIKLNF